ncbi:MAG: response regulator [Alphaproteobacteria bacterium]|nr:response regulator [Alphaproteobacteria bacterium]
MRSGEARDVAGDDAIQHALLGHAHRNSLATMAVQASAAVGICLVAQPSERPFHLGWLAVVLTLLATRLAVDRLLGLALKGGFWADRLPWLSRGHSLGLILSAGLWAALACLRIPVDSPNTRYTLIIILSAMAGGAVGVLSPLKWTGRVYVTLILLPASVILILDHAADATLGVLGVVFWIVMLVGHRNNHRLLVDALRLRDENRDLLEDLERHSQDVVRLNHHLEDRVRARTEDLERLSEDAQVANRAKSQFLATVSHELRTPLNAILGEGQLLARESLTPPQQERLGVITTASRVMRQLIDDVLDISQIEAGGLHLRPNVFSLETLAREIRELYQPLARDNGLTLTLSLAPNLAMYRRGDEDRLRQVVGNLVSNALKFTLIGGVTVKIGGDDEQLKISVIDTGVGVDAKDHETIFHRFVQVDSSSTRRAGGVGLGLAICRELTAQMGGVLTMTSARGIGARFDFTAPLPSVVCSEVQTGEAPAQAGGGAPASLLVVDDNPVNRRILAALVEPFGVECGFAATGKEAVEAWRRQPWGAIFMDVHMPEMDGVEATRSIRAQESAKGLTRTPIIAVTASVLNHEVKSYRDAGMDDILPKPIEAAALADMLSRYAAAA